MRVRVSPLIKGCRTSHCRREGLPGKGCLTWEGKRRTSKWDSPKKYCVLVEKTEETHIWLHNCVFFKKGESATGKAVVSQKELCTGDRRAVVLVL